MPSKRKPTRKRQRRPQIPLWVQGEFRELMRLRNMLEYAAHFSGPIADRFETHTLESGETIQVRIPQQFTVRR